MLQYLLNHQFSKKSFNISNDNTIVWFSSILIKLSLILLRTAWSIIDGATVHWNKQNSSVKWHEKTEGHVSFFKVHEETVLELYKNKYGIPEKVYKKYSY